MSESTNEPESKSSTGIDPEILRIIRQLSDQEREVFGQVLKIENLHLHQKRPSVKDELLAAVKAVVR
jgi:hypothetical protein